MLSNRKLFASALLKQNYLCDKIYVLLYQIATFHTAKCGERGGGDALPLWVRVSWNKRRQAEIVTGTKLSKGWLRTTCYQQLCQIWDMLQSSRQLVARFTKSTDLVHVVPTSLTHVFRKKMLQSQWQLVTWSLAHTIQYQICLNDIVMRLIHSLSNLFTKW
jgi:hypothetical protein